MLRYRITLTLSEPILQNLAVETLRVVGVTYDVTFSNHGTKVSLKSMDEVDLEHAVKTARIIINRLLNYLTGKSLYRACIKPGLRIRKS